ncbi:MAG: hypothetical protein HC861_04635 [Rhodospirillaceae bacterium]|nr:hypothetical protein [Rhodospirillaceae bacterium]
MVRIDLFLRVLVKDGERALLLRNGRCVRVLEPGSFYTATAFADANGTAFTMSPATIGAVRRADDWTTSWTYGLAVSNRGQPLWFAP